MYMYMCTMYSTMYLYISISTGHNLDGRYIIVPTNSTYTTVPPKHLQIFHSRNLNTLGTGYCVARSWGHRLQHRIAHRLRAASTGTPEAPNQLQESLAYRSSACHGQMPQDRLGIAWFRKGPAGGLAEYVGELS